MPCATASIKKPIHNVKEAGKSRKPLRTAEFVSSSLEFMIELVEPIGIEPMTPCLQSRCSPS